MGVTESRLRPRSAPTKLGDEVGGRRPEQPGGRVVLLEVAALGEHRDPVAQPHRLVEVVGDEQHRLAHLALQPEELVLQALADDRVDRAERLVHQQHRRVGGERARHADPLPLTAGELVRVALGVAGRVEPDQLEQLVDPGVDLACGPSRAASGTVATLAAMVWCGNSPVCWMT